MISPLKIDSTPWIVELVAEIMSWNKDLYSGILESSDKMRMAEIAARDKVIQEQRSEIQRLYAQIEDLAFSNP